MSNNKMSVDDILDEINEVQSNPSGPTSSMENVDSIIEQILLDKKNKELKMSNQQLTQSDIEGMETEIKLQTKNLAKQYEKVVRENTRKLKKQERQHIKEQTSSISEILESFSSLEDDLKKFSTQTLKLTTLHPDQKIRFSKPIEHVTESLPNKEKIEQYKQSAHIDHIKREAMDITSHFGSFKEQSQTQIPLNSYRKYKQSRNEKIDSFVLDSTTASSKKNAPVDQPLQENPDPQTSQATPAQILVPTDENKTAQDADTSSVKSANSTGTANVLNEVTSADSGSDMQRLFSSLGHSAIFAQVSVVGLLIMSIAAICLTFIKRTSVSIMWLGSIELPPHDYVKINLVLLIIAVIFSADIFKNVAVSIGSRAPSKDVLYLISVVIMLTVNIMFFLDSEVMLDPRVHLYTPVIIVALLFNRVSKLIVVSKAKKNLAYILSQPYIHSACVVTGDAVCAEMTQGVLDEEIVLVKKVKIENCQEFAENSFKSNQSDSYCLNAGVFMLPVAIIIFVGTYMLTKNINIALSLIGCTAAVSTTFIGSLLVSFPLWDTATVTERFSEMSPCIGAIERLEETNSVLIDAFDLFPKGTVKLQGIKTFSGRRIDTAILDAASVLCKCKSALSHVFLDVIANNTEILKPVDTIVYEDLMGISAWVGEKKVLIGNRDLMINHSIPVPKKEYEDKCHELNQEVVYIATQGELCAAFILGITTKKGIYDSVNLLSRNDIKLIIKSVDASFTVERIAEIFDIEESHFKILPSRLHKQFLDEVAPVKSGEILIGSNGTLMGFILSLVTTKRLSSCITSGIVLNTFCIALGIIIIGALFFFDKLTLLSSFSATAYLGIFGTIYWLMQKNTHI